MKFKTDKKVAGKTVMKDVFWGDHWPGCPGCREVDVDRPNTFIHACAYPGAALLDEELRRRQAPIEREKAAKIRDDAEKAGFDMGRRVSKERLRQITKYVGDE